MRCARVRAVALAGLVAACGALTGTPPSPYPANVCPAVDCLSYAAQTPVPTCQAGACEASAQVDYVLVVAVPETSFFAPGRVFAVRSSDLLSRPTASCADRTCTVLPKFGTVDGAYLVNPAAADAVQRVLGNTGFTALPVRVTLRPLWSLLPTSMPADAVDLGIPLETMFATTKIPSYPNPPPGPGGGPSIDYATSVAPGTFERTIEPISPFDDAFPPDIRTIEAPAPYDQLSVVSIDTTIDAFTFPISRVGGDLAGFTAALVDTSSGRRVSTLVTLHAGDTSATLRVLQVANAPTRQLDLRITPPASLASALPVLAYAFVAGTTPPIVYPALPPLVTVEGLVGGRSNPNDTATPTVATIDLESTEIETAGGDAPAESQSLSFTAHVTSDSLGRYSVALPPGSYTATITPLDPPHVEGASPQPRVYAKNANVDVRVADTPTLQRGRLLEVHPSLTAKGTCHLTDGRPLFGATIVARPAAGLALASVPPTERAVSPSTSPREASTTTDATGAFSLAVDPGTYDLTIEPAKGTRFPWVVLANRAVADAFDFGDITVPAPINEGRTIHDSNDNPILNAVVRAFAIAPGGSAAVEIGASMTDATGRFELDLAGSPR